MQIIEIKELENYLEQLSELLCNCVNNGASIGFITPFTILEAKEYWRSIQQQIASDSKILFLAKDAERIIGTVQLSFCQKKNGLHRAEVEKLMVHTNARGNGVAKSLMQALEHKASNLQKSLIVLDTRKGDTAALLYRALDYQFAGEIPALLPTLRVVLMQHFFSISNSCQINNQSHAAIISLSRYIVWCAQ